jgi:hypothetical protein
VKADRLSQVFGQLIERLGLGYDRKIQTLGDVLVFAFGNADLNDLLHGWALLEQIANWDQRLRVLRAQFRNILHAAGNAAIRAPRGGPWP